MKMAENIKSVFYLTESDDLDGVSSGNQLAFVNTATNVQVSLCAKNASGRATIAFSRIDS
jgi:hypothetical protein